MVDSVVYGTRLYKLWFCLIVSSNFGFHFEIFQDIFIFTNFSSGILAIGIFVSSLVPICESQFPKLSPVHSMKFMEQGGGLRMQYQTKAFRVQRSGYKT